MLSSVCVFVLSLLVRLRVPDYFVSLFLSMLSVLGRFVRLKLIWMCVGLLYIELGSRSMFVVASCL